MAEQSYHDRVVETIREQCARRGIPEDEHKKVKKAIEKEHGKLIELSDPELARVVRGLDAFFEGYLDGAKRRGAAEVAERTEWAP